MLIQTCFYITPDTTIERRENTVTVYLDSSKRIFLQGSKQQMQQLACDILDKCINEFEQILLHTLVDPEKE